MTKAIRITCSSPGFCRFGMQFPAEKTFPADRFTADQLERLRAEQVLRVAIVDLVETEDAAVPAIETTLVGEKPQEFTIPAALATKIVHSSSKEAVKEPTAAGVKKPAVVPVKKPAARPVKKPARAKPSAPRKKA